MQLRRIARAAALLEKEREFAGYGSATALQNGVNDGDRQTDTFKPRRPQSKLLICAALFAQKGFIYFPFCDRLWLDSIDLTFSLTSSL